MVGMKPKLLPLVVIGASAALFGGGCETPQQSKNRVETVTSATAAISQQKDIAEQWAQKLKRNKATVAPADMQTAEEKYREAASQNKGYLEAVGQAIINKTNLAGSPIYKSLAAKAESSTKDFVDFAKSKTGAPAAPKSFVGAGVAAGILVDAGITIWKEYQAEAKADREAQADRLISRNRWEDWDKIR
jgi:hypothetical protein